MVDLRTIIRRAWYKAKHDLMTLNNAMIAVAVVLGVSLIWSSIEAMSQNYELQKKVDGQRREALILELETATLEYEQNYYRTREYQELAARERLGLSQDGEKLLILPENSMEAKQKYDAEVEAGAHGDEDTNNFYQWMKFLFGQNSRS